jgi:hypothetical protein
MIEQLATYPVGTLVRVIEGSLTGLIGEVIKVAEGESNYVLVVDGWGDGICLSVLETMLELVHP